jgi:hypothetical protein
LRSSISGSRSLFGEFAYILVAILGCAALYLGAAAPTLSLYDIDLIFFALDGAFRLIAQIRANVPGKAERVRPAQFVAVGAGETGATPEADT